NFSTDSKEIEVTVNGVKAEINSCSETDISITCPNLESVPCVLTVDIKVGGTSIAKQGKLIGGLRQIPNDGSYDAFTPASHLL
ncbi:MAG: hypothetical protein K8F91_14305, partial [Candidatus Obscuribacterales bacterium]|nr:hypothetical protein [Candidatus Obscuribacterales bacterium]